MKWLNKILKIKKSWVVLFLIVLVAAFLRFYQLGDVPKGFHGDEASLGYNAYSILMTGKDEGGNMLPLTINTFGDFRPAGYVYLAIISIKLLGLSVLATRLPAAFFGAILVLPFFFLVQNLFRNVKISLVSAFLIAISPWSIVLSRASAETIIALFFIVFGYLIFLVGFKNKNTYYYLLGIFFLSISFIFYHTPRVFVPLLILLTLIYLYPIWKKFRNKSKIIFATSFLILCLISFSLVFLMRGGVGRFSQVNIFSHPGIKLVLEEQIREDGVNRTPLILTRTFHNKLVNYSLGFIDNYFSYFTGNFLFISGGLPIRYAIPGVGLINIVELPFILIGLYYLLSSKDRYYKLPLIWLFLAPLTAAFTQDDVPNINRAIVMFPIIELLAGYGFVSFVDKFKGINKRLIFGIITIFIISNLVYFLHQYFVHQELHRPWYREYAYQPLSVALNKLSPGFKKIVMGGSAGSYTSILFWDKYDPLKYQLQGSPGSKYNSGFGKYYFVLPDCPLTGGKSGSDTVFGEVGILYVDKGDCVTPLYNAKLIKTINWQDGTAAFKLLEYISTASAR